EEFEKRRRRSVKKRTPRLVLLSEDLHEIALEQELEHRAAIDAANVVDLGTRDRLAIREDRERLHLRAREAHRFLLREIAAERPELRVRSEEPTAGDFVELHAARRKFALQLRENRARFFQRRARGLRELVRLDRLVAREDERFDE